MGPISNGYEDAQYPASVRAMPRGQPLAAPATYARCPIGIHGVKVWAGHVYTWKVPLWAVVEAGRDAP